MNDEQKISDMTPSERGQLAEAIVMLRTAKQVRAESLASELGIRRDSYYAIERGGASARLTARVIHLLGTTVEGLLSWHQELVAGMATLPTPPDSEVKGA